MTLNFEEIGRRVGRELERVRRVVESEIKPTTKQKVAATLRRASERLAKLARELEGRSAEKSE